MTSPRLLRVCLSWLLPLVPFSTALPQQSSPTESSWRYTAPAKIQALRVCGNGQLLLTTGNQTVILDAETGTPQANVAEPRLGSARCHPDLTTFSEKNLVGTYDLATGMKVWESTLEDVREIRRQYRATRNGILLLAVKTTSSDNALAAVELSTGRLLWLRDDPILAPKIESRMGAAVRMMAQSTQSQHPQPLIGDSDSTFIVYWNPHGPIRVHAGTGQILWRDSTLQAKPNYMPAHAEMALVGSLLLVPHDKRLLAINVEDGRVVWHTSSRYPQEITSLAGTSAGVLVRIGDNHLRLLDYETGEERWTEPVKLTAKPVAFEVRSSHHIWAAEEPYFLIAGDQLMTLNIATGRTASVSRVVFDGGESPELIAVAGDVLLIASRQNLAALTLQGAPVYQRFYKAPGASLLSKIGGTLSGNLDVLSARYGSANFADQDAYFLTDVADGDGRTGISLVRVSLADGAERGRLWLRNKKAEYLLDEDRGQVLVFENDKTLMAARFPVQ